MWLGEAASLQKVEGGVQVSAGDNQMVVEKVLASLGRKPNLDNLNLDATDIKLDDRGILVFDLGNDIWFANIFNFIDEHNIIFKGLYESLFL